MNKLIISGRLTADPEHRKTTDGKAVVSFNFAVNRRFKAEGQPEADFFQCVAFSKIAEAFEKFSIGKGTKLLIEGEVRNNNYEKDGVKHYGTQIFVNSFEFCESKSTASGNNAAASAAPTFDDFTEANTYEDDDDDLPF